MEHKILLKEIVDSAGVLLVALIWTYVQITEHNIVKLTPILALISLELFTYIALTYLTDNSPYTL